MDEQGILKCDLDATDDQILWNSIMDDDRVVQLGARMKGDKTQLKWRYENGPYFYRWFNFTK